MDRFFGFDLGDAESAVSHLYKKDQTVPEILPVCGEKSFITAYARLAGGELLIGEKACYSADAIKRKLRFKSHFLDNPESAKDIKSFAAGVLGELYGNGDLIKNEDCCFYIGCPAGWDKNAREEYREIFERVGFPPAKIISESRAALVSACQSKHLQVGHDILSKPVLVVDIGSSTTDFAYICGGKEVEMQTAGEVRLGGGIMDEILLEESVARSSFSETISRIFSESEPWRSYCEFAARRLKEKYFSEEDYWKDNPCTETVLIRQDYPVRLTLRMDADIASLLFDKKTDKLEGRSFREVFMDSLRAVRENISGDMPELLFLTGGVSRMPEIRGWCREAFPEAVIISGAEPEFSVARGLAWCGRVDEEMREFRAELEELMNSDKVENIVERHIDDLYREAVEALVDPILKNVAEPVFDRWRKGEIRRLVDTDEVMRQEIESYLHTDEIKDLLSETITKWLKPVAEELEEHTVPICVRHNVPYSALSLGSYLNASDIDIQVDAKNIFAVEEITWLIDSIISVLVGLLCGGSGMTLISSGLPGILAGIMLSLAVLALGKGSMEKALLRTDIPAPMRRLVPKKAFAGRMESISGSVKKNLYKSFENEKNEEITTRMVNETSQQIELCLTKMAEIVEIPLG